MPFAPEPYLVRPFRGLRPAPAYAQAVAAPPYDVLDTEEARVMAAGNPWSFLHVSKPEIDLPKDTDPHAPVVYRQAGRNIAAMMAAGVLIQDRCPCYYIYRIEAEGHRQTGFVMAGSLDAYEGNRIRRHELTRPDKEDDRVAQILALNAQTGPVFTTHKENPALDTLADRLTGAAAAFDVSLAGVRHQLWVVSETEDIAAVTAGFEDLGVIYIADGHHRSAAAARVRAARRDRALLVTGGEPYQDFLVVSFPESQVRILDYNRVVKDLNGLTPDQFLARLREAFEIIPAPANIKPETAMTFSVYVAGKWVGLRYKGGTTGNAVRDLDVTILTENLLAPILGVGDPRIDPRIDFIGGSRGMAELERRVDGGEWAVAIALFPTSLGQLMAVADAEEIMPPKSTWFDPKLADGLVSLVLD